MKTARPVFEALANDKLRETMPVEYRGERHDRPEYTHLEAVGRSLAHGAGRKRSLLVRSRWGLDGKKDLAGRKPPLRSRPEIEGL